MLGGCAVLLSLVATIRGEMEGYIVGGAEASIQRYPHSAFLTVTCVKGKNSNGEVDQVMWICGSSVVNQKILLTAGHCVYSCLDGTKIMVNLGNVDKMKGMFRSASGFVLHEKYDSSTSTYDIALIKMFTDIKFSSKIARVALMPRPPYTEPARLAGWGLVDEVTKEHAKVLKQVDQKVWKHEDCQKLFGTVPRGSICASAHKDFDFPAQGDSGSGLVVRGFIQIGLVSYKVPNIAPNVIIYTDVGYYYNWIKNSARQLFCADISME